MGFLLVAIVAVVTLEVGPWSMLVSADTPGVPCWTDTCEFTFSLTLGYTMTRTYLGGAVDELVLHPGGCLRPDGADAGTPCVDVAAGTAGSRVMTGDGRRRGALLVNGQFPGPTLEVTEGAMVTVHVQNAMGNVNTAIHWHGQVMNGSQWMDGSGFITQCPIPPGHTFSYRFVASPSGTHWYHPHLGNLRSDGHYGLLVVHKTRPTITWFPLLLSDWNLNDGIGVRLTDIRVGSIAEIPEAVSSLVNGRGRHEGVREAPLSRFEVEAGKRYRFRCANAASDIGYAISVDLHMLTIVAWDGTELMPIQTDFVNVFAGERVDFEITVNGDTDSVWLRAEALPMPDSGINPLNTVAALSTTTMGTVEPTSQTRDCTSNTKCTVFNCFRPFAVNEYKVCIDLKNIKTADFSYVSKYISQPSSSEIFLNFATTIGDSINARRFVVPQSPFYDPHPQGLISCQELSCQSTTETCWCTNRLPLQHNKVITLIVSNLEADSESHEGSIGHPVHIHGHHFALIANGFAEYNLSTGEMRYDNNAIVCESMLCKSPSWNPAVGRSGGDLHLNNPPLKDTVIIPPGGYVVLRLVTDNPGHWLLHCHLLRDQIDGMQLYLEVAADQIRAPPSQLPPCSPYAKTSYQPGYTPTPNNANQADPPWDLPPEDGLSSLEVIGVAIGAFGACVLLVLVSVLLTRYCGRHSDQVSPHNPMTHF